MAVSTRLGDGLTVGIEHLWPLAVLPVVVALLAYLVFRERSDTRSASTRSRRLLFASRVLVACLLVVGAMGPYTVQTRETPGEPEVTLLTDDSDSMGVYPDAAEDLVADVEAEGVPVTTATVGSGTNSRIGDGIAANLRENGTAVVLSDGQVTEGRSLAMAADEAASLNATIHRVDLDATSTERAVSIAGPSTTSVGLPAEFTVSLDGVRADDPVDVELVIDNETVATESIAAGESFTTSHIFESTGSHRVTATIDGEDVYAENDVFYRSVRVVEQPSLLYVSPGGYPLEEYLSELYDVTTADSVPSDLEEYAAVVVQDTPAARLGEVGALQEHVIDGGGLVVVGGESAYESGGYDESSIASMLPVSVGEDSGGTADVVLLIDVSGSARQGMAIQKAVSLDVLDQLDDRNRVGVVAFKHRAYRVADLGPLGQTRTDVADAIRRLESGGATDIAIGLQGADEMLADREGTIILLTDGQDPPQEATRVADRLGREGTRVIAVGAGESVDAGALRRISRASGGTYLAADETSRLQLLFGGSSPQTGDGLTVVTRGTFITSGVELTADPERANEVSVKPGADYQVATGDGTPAITSWRFGLGRVASITAFDDDGTLGPLLERPDSLVVTKTVNYAVGDPMRTWTGVTAVDDSRVGQRATLTYRGERPPDSDAVSFRQVAEGRYTGEFTPQEAGYGEVLNTEYAANYPPEYGAFGTNRALSDAVARTGGEMFGVDEGAAIARQARQQSTRVRSVRDDWGWLALVVGLLAFAGEVVARRVQVYRGRSTLESGLP